MLICHYYKAFTNGVVVLPRLSFSVKDSVTSHGTHAQKRHFIQLFTNRCTFIRTFITIYVKLDGCYMFRSTTIIRELATEPGESYTHIETFSKVVIRWCGSMSQYGVCTVFCDVQSETEPRSAQHTIYSSHWDMLPHHRITTLLNILISI